MTGWGKVDLSSTESLVVALAHFIRPKFYLEVGIHTGETISRIRDLGGYCLGIDIADKRPTAHHGLYEFRRSDSSSWLKDSLPAAVDEHGPIELAFIDADHTFEGSLRDFDLVFPHVCPDGIICLHDVWPLEERYTGPVPRDPRGSWFGDVYKTADVIRQRDECEIVTFPAANIAIIRKGRRSAPWLPETPPCA